MATQARTCSHPATSAYRIGLDQNAANHAPLTPLSFLDRTAEVYPDRIACLHGRQRITYRALRERCRRLASALERRGIRPGDTVAAMLPNIPAMLEAHYGVPMCGAVLNALNVRLDAAALAFILQHGEAKALLTDTEFAPVMREAVAQAGREMLVVDVDDPEGPGGERLGGIEYEAFLAEGDPGLRAALPGRRVAGDRAQLHLGYHRQPEGRGLPPPRRAPERGRQRAGLGHGALPGLPVDPADVPLQRLVLPLVDRAPGRHAGLPAPGRERDHLRGARPSKASPTSAAPRSSWGCSSTRPRRRAGPSPRRSG